MGDYKLSLKAERDLVQLYEYGIETFGLKQAKVYFIGMHTLFQLLGDNSELGKSASELKFSLKKFVYKSHIIFYSIKTHDILIVRVLSQTMDYESHFMNK
ncbi:type II toxin-antitoxin system RelE/ParE family toxin [Mesonia sp.]|uniref:type II toxin-antitoxin system RelE/ParE family toxin n=1 Tax=Mesonia sp. TaxID=1960830 RepID=UPI003F9E8FF8